MSPGRRCIQTRPSLRPSEGRGSACRSVRVVSSGENWCCPTTSLAGSSLDSDHRKKNALGARTRLRKHIDVVEVGYVADDNEPMVIKVSTVRGADKKVQLQSKGKKVNESDQESARESTGSSDQYETFEIDENTEYSSAEDEEEIRERKGYQKEVEGLEGSPAKKKRPDQKQVNKFSVIDPRRQALQKAEQHRNCCDNSEVGDDSSTSGSLGQEAAYSRPRDKITTSFSQPITKDTTDLASARQSKSLPLQNSVVKKKPSRKLKRANPNYDRYRSREVMPRCKSRDRTRCCRCSSKDDEDEDDDDDDSSRPGKCMPGCKKALPIEISLQHSPHRRSHAKKYIEKTNGKFATVLTPIDPFNTNFFFGHTIDETILEMMHTLSLLKYNGSTDQKKQNLSLCPAKKSQITSALTGNLMVQQSTFLRNALGSTVDEVLLSSYSRIRTMFQSKDSRSGKEERTFPTDESEFVISTCTEDNCYRAIPDLDKLSGLAIDDTVDVVNWLRDEYVALAEDEKLSKRQKKVGPGPLSPESLRQRRYVLDCLTQVMRKKKEMEDRKKGKQRMRTSVPRKRKGAAMLTMAPTNCACSSPSPCEHGTIPALLVQATPSEVARIKKLAQQSDGTTMFQPQNFSPTFADQAVLNPVETSLPHPEGNQGDGYVSIGTKETADDGPIVQELHFNKNAQFDSGQSDSLTYNSGYSFMTHGSIRHGVSTSYDSSMSVSNSSSTECSRCFGSYQYEHRTDSCLSCISVSTGHRHRRKIRPYTPTQYTRTTDCQFSPSQSSISETPSSYMPDLRYEESHVSSDSTTDLSDISPREWNKRRRERFSRDAASLKKHNEKNPGDKCLHCTYMTDKPFESSLEQLNFISSFTDSPDKFEETSLNIQSCIDGSTTEDCEKPPISSSPAPLKHLSERSEKFEDLLTKPLDCVVPCPGDFVSNVINVPAAENQACYKNTTERVENQKCHRRCKWTNFSSPQAELAINRGTLPTGREDGSASGNLRYRLIEEMKSKGVTTNPISNTSQKQEPNNECFPEKCIETPSNSPRPVNNRLQGLNDPTSNVNYCPPRQPENNEFHCCREKNSNIRERNGETSTAVPRDIVEELEIYFRRNNDAYSMPRSEERNSHTKAQNIVSSPNYVKQIQNNTEFQQYHVIKNERASPNIHRQEEKPCKSSYPQKRIQGPKCNALGENCQELLSHPLLKGRLSPDIHEQEVETTKRPHLQTNVRAQCLKFYEEINNQKMYSPNPKTKDELSLNNNNNNTLKKETPKCCEPKTQTVENQTITQEETKPHKKCFPLRVFKKIMSPDSHKKEEERSKHSSSKHQITEINPSCSDETQSDKNTPSCRVQKARKSSVVHQQEEQVSKTPHTVLEEKEQSKKCHEETDYHRQISQCHVLKDGYSINKEECLTQGETQRVNSSCHSLGRCCSSQEQTCNSSGGCCSSQHQTCNSSGGCCSSQHQTCNSSGGCCSSQHQTCNSSGGCCSSQHQTCNSSGGCCSSQHQTHENEGSILSEGTTHDVDYLTCAHSEDKASQIPPKNEQESKKQCHQIKSPLTNSSCHSIDNGDHRCLNNEPRIIKSISRCVDEWSSQESTNCDLSGCSPRTSFNEVQSCIKLYLDNTRLSENVCLNDTSRQYCSEIKREDDEDTYIVPKSCVSPMNAPEVTDGSSVYDIAVAQSPLVDISEALLVPLEAEKKNSEIGRLEKPENNSEVAKIPTKGTAEGDGLNQGRHILNPDQELIMNMSPTPIRISQTQSDTQAVRISQDVKERRTRQHANTLVDNVAYRRLKKDKRTAERDSNNTQEMKNTAQNLNSGQNKPEPSVEDLVAAIYRANVFYASHNMERSWNNFTMREITPPSFDKTTHEPPLVNSPENSDAEVKETNESKEEQKGLNVCNKPSEVSSKKKEDHKERSAETKSDEVNRTKEKHVSKSTPDEKAKSKERKKSKQKDEVHSASSHTNLHSRKTKEARELRKKRSGTKVNEKKKTANKNVVLKYISNDGLQTACRKSFVNASRTSSDSQQSKSPERQHVHRDRCQARITHEHTSEKRLYIKPTATPSRPMRLFSYLTSRRPNEELCKEHRMLKVMHINAHTRYGPRLNRSCMLKYLPMEKEPSRPTMSHALPKDIKRDRFKMNDERALVPKRDNNITSPLARRLNNHIQNLSSRYRKSPVGDKVRERHSYPEGRVTIAPPEEIRKIHSNAEENRMKIVEFRKRRNNASLDRTSRRCSTMGSEGSKSSARMSLMQIAKNTPFVFHRRQPVQIQTTTTNQNPHDSNSQAGDEKQKRNKKSKHKDPNESTRNGDNKPQGKPEDKTTETDLRGKKKKPPGGSQGQTVAKSSPTKVLWAITRINIFDDNSRTYEVMKPTYKTPKKIPSTTEGLFALTPQ